MCKTIEARKDHRASIESTYLARIGCLRIAIAWLFPQARSNTKVFHAAKGNEYLWKNNTARTEQDGRCRQADIPLINCL